jgi:hypothetical protein
MTGHSQVIKSEQDAARGSGRGNRSGTDDRIPLGLRPGRLTGNYPGTEFWQRRTQNLRFRTASRVWRVRRGRGEGSGARRSNCLRESAYGAWRRSWPTSAKELVSNHTFSRSHLLRGIPHNGNNNPRSERCGEVRACLPARGWSRPVGGLRRRATSRASETKR